MMYRFNDEVLLELFRRVQLAMFTNTDVIDNIRRMELFANPDGTLSLTEEYKTLTTNEVNAYIHQAAVAMDKLRPADEDENFVDVAQVALDQARESDNEFN